MPHLKTLRLTGNRNIGQGGTVQLITSLTVQNTLEELLLIMTGIGVEDCRALNELVSSSTSLTKLEISGNDLLPEAVELIVRGLQHNTTLEWLNMSNSQFSPQNIISLTSVMSTNHTVVHLDLRHCNIDSDGACQLANVLCTSNTLQILYLEGNPIGVKGATAFAEMLLRNKSLKKTVLTR